MENENIVLNRATWDYYAAPKKVVSEYSCTISKKMWLQNRWHKYLSSLQISDGGDRKWDMWYKYNQNTSTSTVTKMGYCTWNSIYESIFNLQYHNFLKYDSRLPSNWQHYY